MREAISVGTNSFFPLGFFFFFLHKLKAYGPSLVAVEKHELVLSVLHRSSKALHQRWDPERKAPWDGGPPRMRSRQHIHGRASGDGVSEPSSPTWSNSVPSK